MILSVDIIVIPVNYNWVSRLTKNQSYFSELITDFIFFSWLRGIFVFTLLFYAKGITTFHSSLFLFNLTKFCEYLFSFDIVVQMSQHRSFISSQPLSLFKHRILSYMEITDIIYHGRSRNQSHILEDPPSHDSDDSKTSEQYLSWKKNDCLLKSWIKEHLQKKFFIW